MRRLSQTLTATLLASTLLLQGSAVANANDTVTEPAPPLVITEIMQDNAGTPNDQDYFEFFEVHNTTDAAVDFADYSVRYYNSAGLTVVEEGTETALTDVEIPAGGTAVFWLRYAVGSGDAAVTQWELTEADFREHYGDADSEYALFHAIGQGGFANSGSRPLRIFDDAGDIVSESHYNRAAANRGFSDHFTLPATGSLLTDTTAGEPTPGAVDAAQLVRPEPEPEPDPDVVLGNAGNASAISPLVITEINGDNPGADLYEYLEVTNTTGAPIDLTAAGIEIRYHTSAWNAGTVQPLVHLEGEDDAPAVIPAGGVALFWMNYDEGDQRRSIGKDEFRSFYGIDSDVPVVRFGNQRGFANAGNRGFSISDAEGLITRAWVPADDGISSTPWNAQFAVPDTVGERDARLVEHTHADEIAPTPGTITIEQVTSALDRVADPELDGAPILQITELAPDTANVGGSDGFEFVEVYNASDAAVNWGDYTLSYLYTNNALSGPVTNSTTLWPSSPADVTIEPGESLVLWVKNPAGVEAGLTVTDFNAEFGTELVLGETIVELFNGGMANGGSRGIQVLTDTGHDISRAYYFSNDQTTPTTAIQYAWNPATTSAMWTPEPADGTVQTLLGLAAPSPGRVSPDQVPSGLVEAPDAGAAPVIEDLTGTDEAPSTGGVDLAFRVTDDVLVRSVQLKITDNLGQTLERSLVVSGEDMFTFSMPAADLYGKRWIEYSLVASDGAQTTLFGPVRQTFVEGEPDPLRMNLEDGQFVTGTHRIAASTAGDPDELSLTIDGTRVDGSSSLEASPVFAFEATATDAFFRNGVKLGDDVLTIFDEGFYSRIETVDATVPVDRVQPGEPLTLTITAGTKAWPEADVNENNDDFSAMNFRLALPDGRVLSPVSCATTWEADGAETSPAPYTCPADADTRVSFSDAGLVSLLLTFEIPEDAFDSIAVSWDTTEVADGAHTVVAAAGTESIERTVQVDNTAPTVASEIEAGQTYRGEFEIDATASDAGSGVAELTATLDGEPITLPHTASSHDLAPGEHVLAFRAVDAVGNAATSEVEFRTADEQPTAELVGPEDGASADQGDVILKAKVSSPEDDLLDVSFREGYAFVPTDAEVTAASGTTTSSRDTARDEAVALTEDELADLVGVDGVAVEASSDTALPYQLFTVAVPEDAGDDATVRATWTGTANADARVTMYALTTDGAWQQVDEHLTTQDGAVALAADAEDAFDLVASVPVDGYVADGVVTLLVQHSEGFAGTPRSTRESSVESFNADATPRSEYDFTIAWESDTQYYNRNEGVAAGTGGSDTLYQHQLNIHDFVLAERDNLNIQYLVHTGDIIDGAQFEHQWENADAAYRMLDEAGMPYGVLAGNHDVHGRDADYTEYGQVFGEARFADNPWYGGSYKDNRGHYDLISANGVDLLVLYMGWPDHIDQVELNTQDIEWMNSVIRQYPERHVWINLHEYMLTTGGLGPFPQRVLDEVVATNPNVFAVGSGHYHDAYTRTDQFDDDGDGVAERTVTSMLFDYQGLPEGGQGYLRLLHFDNEGERILVRTYSPSLDRFNSDDAALNDPPGMQEFEIPYAAAGITPKAKTLATDAFRAEVLTQHEIGSVSGVESGATAEVAWEDAPVGEVGWYVVTTGPHGGEYASPVSMLTVMEVDAGGDDGNGDEGDGEPGTGGDDGSGEPGTGGGSDDDAAADDTSAGDGDGSEDITAPEPGESGEVGGDSLPTTGASLPWLVVGAALILLLAGIALVIRRRRTLTR